MASSSLDRSTRGILVPLSAFAIEASVPAGGFTADRYQSLWESSPFAVATPVAIESSDYALVGAAEFDGISYVSLIDRQSKDHFLITTNTPAHGLSLISLVHGNDPGSTYATFQKGSETLRLKLETGASSAPGAPPPSIMPQPVPTIPPPPQPFLSHRPPRAHFFSPPVYVPRPPSYSP